MSVVCAQRSSLRFLHFQHDFNYSCLLLQYCQPQPALNHQVNSNFILPPIPDDPCDTGKGGRDHKWSSLACCNRNFFATANGISAPGPAPLKQPNLLSHVSTQLAINSQEEPLAGLFSYPPTPCYAKTHPYLCELECTRTH